VRGLKAYEGMVLFLYVGILKMRYKIRDVKGDGSCFYRSIYTVLNERGEDVPSVFIQKIRGKREMTKIKDENAFVVLLRKIIAYTIKYKLDNDYIHMCYINCRSLEKEDWLMFLEGFPTWFSKAFKKIPKSEDAFRLKIAECILEMGSWASEIEISIIKDMVLSKLKTEIIVLNSVATANATEFNPKFIYLLNIDEVHYNAIIPKKKIIKKKQSAVDTTKKCEAHKILNPPTKRCVLRSGKIGKILIGGKKKCEAYKILNPSTNRCVLRSGSIGKKLVDKK
jgi:hypothetical protein